MAKFIPVTVPDNVSFSDWIQPVMDNYKMACCDCGLVHDMEFKVVEVVKDLGNGYKEIQEVENVNLVAQFRARRNNRSTEQLRRKSKNVEKGI